MAHLRNIFVSELINIILWNTTSNLLTEHASWRFQRLSSLQQSLKTASRSTPRVSICKLEVASVVSTLRSVILRMLGASNYSYVMRIALSL